MPHTTSGLDTCFRKDWDPRASSLWETTFSGLRARLIYDILSEYSFPDEDFCSFRHFPHKKAIITVMINENPEAQFKLRGLTKSCAYRFLAQNNLIMSNAFEVTLDHYFYFPSFIDSELEECEFEKNVLSLWRIIVFDSFVRYVRFVTTWSIRSSDWNWSTQWSLYHSFQCRLLVSISWFCW